MAWHGMALLSINHGKCNGSDKITEPNTNFHGKHTGSQMFCTANSKQNSYKYDRLLCMATWHSVRIFPKFICLSFLFRIDFEFGFETLNI